MQEKEYTYRPVSASVLTDSFRNLLFGKLSPIQLCTEYRELKPVILKFLRGNISEPGQYLDARSTLPELPGFTIAGSAEPGFGLWESPFYRFELTGLEAFHPLCEFYQKFVYRECRLVISMAEAWRSDGGISNRRLKYELTSITELLSVFIRLCEERDLASPDDSREELTERLRIYLARLLKLELGATLFELSERFKDLLDTKAITPEAFYIHILNQAVPELLPFYTTRFSVLYTLEHMNYQKKPARDLKALKVSLMQEKDFRCRVRNEEQAAGCVLIENVCVAWYLLRVTKATDKEFNRIQSDPTSAVEIIKHWCQAIKKGEEEDVLVSICRYMDEIQSVLEPRIEGAEPSEAFRFIQAMEHKGVLVQPNEHVGVPFNQDSNGKRDNGGSHPLLQDLVSIDELRERLQISMVTLNKYLEDSGIPVIRFSAKSRWLRSGDCQKFLDYFTTEGRSG